MLINVLITNEFMIVQINYLFQSKKTFISSYIVIEMKILIIQMRQINFINKRPQYVVPTQSTHCSTHNRQSKTRKRAFWQDKSAKFTWTTTIRKQGPNFVTRFRPEGYFGVDEPGKTAVEPSRILVLESLRVIFLGDCNLFRVFRLFIAGGRIGNLFRGQLTPNAVSFLTRLTAPLRRAKALLFNL